MIRSYFGIEAAPFDPRHVCLLPQQEEVLDTLRVHCQQGGLCLILGEPGTGKSVLKQALIDSDPKRLIAPAIARTLHTYLNTLKVLCEAFAIDFDGGAHTCEKRIIDEAFRLNRQGKMIAPVIDDAHLMDVLCLRRLRLLLEDFPKNHNLVLVAQPCLVRTLALAVNEDIRSRVTYSVAMMRLTNEQTQAFILDQFDRAGLAHNVFTDRALNLIARSSDGVLRKARNLCLGCLVEAIRDQTRTVDIDHVNAVLKQPHWRAHHDLQQT